MSEDVKHMAKLKQLNWTDEQIAEKMGKSVEWVKTTWDAAVQKSIQQTESGYNELVQLYNLLCLQHSLTGESLKAIGMLFSDTVNQKMLSEAIEACPENISLEQHILNSFIVLKRFTPEDPLKQLERHIQSN